ncbi:type II toxin-antitoxin system RelE/ParE family toxin [Devosia beringensis]|uniref:type II toxin-antitoxin system RelE/ParE family toxin n=1 Tax=Devosia beringensis TaxID=2657486 RepID=UPI00186B91A0|nr:type II toxin-antitoxin system RelE/ParE family toxin [Devosia beringensis]
MRVVYAPASLRDLAEIGDYIAFDSRGRARTFVVELRAACRSLAADSRRYPYQQELTDIRRMPVGNCLVLYRVLEDSVRIIRVIHAARDIGSLTL